VTFEQYRFLLIAAVFLFFVTLIFLIVYIRTASRKKRPLGKLAYELESAPSEATPSAPGQELVLARDDWSGRLLVEVEGTRYRSLDEIQDPEAKRQVVQAAMELIQFTGVLGRGSVEPAPMDKTQSWREDLRQGSRSELEQARRVAPPAGATVPDEVEQQFLDLLSDMGHSPTQPEKPTLMGAIQRRYLSSSAGAGSSYTFVDEIEAIVQRRVPLIPALQGRGLHVRPGPAGKVLFVFEGREYQSVDEVPNLTARQLVQDAIREWDETT
jgi:hypothetical protein